jgi:hypothetical protein
MMNPVFETLGIDAAADERTIKRAYAAKLKTTRPEQDPQGFQALNEAYQTALAWHRARDAGMFADMNGRDPDALGADGIDNEDRAADSIVEERRMHASAGEDRPSIETPPFAPQPHAAVSGTVDAAKESDGEEIDAQRFFDACFEAAHDGDPRVIDRWLNAQPILWSLQHKAMIGHWLLRAMDERTPPMPDRNFDRIAQFFGYHELHGGYDPLALRELRVRVNDAWRRARAAIPPARMGTSGSASSPGPHSFRQAPDQGARMPADIEQERRESAYMHRLLRLHRHLVEPPSLLRNLRLGLNLKHAASVREIVFDNPYGDLDALPERIRRDQIAFWLAVDDDRRWARPRLLVALVRCLALALPVFPVMPVLLMADSPKAGLTTTILLKAIAYPFALLALTWLVVASLKSLLYWQGGPDPAATWRRRAHGMTVPLLAMGSVASLLLEGTQIWSFPIGIIAVWTAFVRWLQRGRGAGPTWKAHPFLAMMCLSLLALPFVFQNKTPSIAALALAALLLWGHDLMRRRRRP